MGKNRTNENKEIYKVNGRTFNSKVDLDKYYTPIELAKYCIDKTYEIIGKENITEIIEPSAGCGNFSLQIPNCIAYDIAPEHENIIQKDFFEVNLPYKKGRLIIGNPPYGCRGHLSLQFFKHSIQMAEYVAFILPASQYNNNYRTYEYDLIYSELLYNSGRFKDLDKRVKLAFNIYKRPIGGFNKRKKYKFEDFELYEYKKHVHENYKEGYDFKILSWGGTIETCGRILGEDEHYHKEIIFYIHNEDMKEPIKKLFETNNIMKEYCMTSTPNITLWMVYEYILKYIPNIK